MESTCRKPNLLVFTSPSILVIMPMQIQVATSDSATSIVTIGTIKLYHVNNLRSCNVIKYIAVRVISRPCRISELNIRSQTNSGSNILMRRESFCLQFNIQGHIFWFVKRIRYLLDVNLRVLIV